MSDMTETLTVHRSVFKTLPETP